MNLPLYYYALGTPLGLLGLIRWGAWLIRGIPVVLYKPTAGDHLASMATVVPVYQEDPEILATAIESWPANRIEQVILVIDASDTTCQEVARRYPVQVVITDVPGKRDALRCGPWVRRYPFLAYTMIDKGVGSTLGSGPSEGVTPLPIPDSAVPIPTLAGAIQLPVPDAERMRISA